MGGNEKRYVGIIADGGTDHAILALIAQVCLGTSCEVVELRRQSLRDSVDAYWKTKKTDEVGAAEKEVVKAVQGVLVAGLGEFESRIPRPASSNDVLILSTDAERHFSNHEEQYFEPWAWNLISAAQLGIEKFVQGQVAQGRTCEYVPVTTLFIPFPSTDVLVAAVRTEKVRGMRATELKQLLYKTTSLHELGNDDFAKYALDFIKSENLKHAFHRLPEVRGVLTSLVSGW